MSALMLEGLNSKFMDVELLTFEKVGVIFPQEILDKLGAVSRLSLAYVLPFVNDGLINLVFVGDVRIRCGV